jgi:hypothetical protein
MKRKLVLLASALIVLASLVFLLIKQRRNQSSHNSGGVTIAADGTIVANQPEWDKAFVVTDLKKMTNGTPLPKGGPNAK